VGVAAVAAGAAGAGAGGGSRNSEKVFLVSRRFRLLSFNTTPLISSLSLRLRHVHIAQQAEGRAVLQPGRGQLLVQLDGVTICV
jgi:hypothetical protein